MSGLRVVGAGERHVVAAIVDALLGGGPVALPTDTVYGLAALPTDKRAVERLFAVKGRASDSPVAVLCADAGQALGLAAPDAAAAVAAAVDRFWPGPLTLVLPRRPGVDLHLGEPETTIGLRVPDHDLIRRVTRAVGPIAATSANRHGEPTLTSAAAVVEALGVDVALVVDGGELSAAASTVVDATSAPWRVLREGDLSGDEVLASQPTSGPGDR